MKKISLPFTLLFTVYIFYSCNPKTIVSTTQSYPALRNYEPFVVFALNDTVDLTQAVVVGEVKIMNLTAPCDYETVISDAEQQARKMGANAIKIYEHRQPDIVWGNCHRIKAKALKIVDVSSYEKEIVWHEERKLSQTDFKASPVNRPFEAATSTSIRYHWSGTPISGKVTFKTQAVFFCQNSYFKNTLNPTQILGHEQLHFDITEIFARKFVKNVQEKLITFKELEQQHKEFYNQIIKEWQDLQDKYDYEIYNEISTQQAWSQKIQLQLDSLSNWEEKEIVLPFKNKD